MKVPKKSGYAKFRQVMRIGMIQLTMALTCCGLSMAAVNHAQLLDKSISITLSEVSFTEALKEIESRANISFVYSVDQLSDEMPVTLHVTDKPLREILDQLLTPRHISYKVYEKDKTLSLKKQLPERQPAPKFRDRANTQTLDDRLEVSGTVTDATTQQPMPGVNILVKGTTTGTTTDASGRYALTVQDNDVLIFSFIGYSSREILVTSRSVIDVVMLEDAKSLNEVVVNAGYYTTTKATQTGNIGKVDAVDIQKQPVSNPLAALQARVPGLEIVQQTGVPGGNFRVRIRGTNSIANGNEPLYIIDGVPFMSGSMSFLETSGNILGNPSVVAGQGSSLLNSLNPSDIESIEVLKDADATAIYGSRGSNGVILITTKRGKEGKTKLEFNFYQGAGSVTTKMDLLSTSKYLQMRKEAFANDGIIPTSSNARDLLQWDTTRYTDWQERLIGGTATTTDAQLSASGGDKFTQFSIGVGYHKESTVFPGDFSDQRASLRSSVTNVSKNQKLKTSLSINYSAIFTNLLKQDLTSLALLLPPVAPQVHDANGELYWTNWSSTYENPLAYTRRMFESRTSNLIGNATIGYSILPSLELKSSIGYTSTNAKAVTTTPISSQFPDPGAQNFSSFSNSSFENWIIEPQLNWKPILPNGKIDVLLGTTFLNQVTDGLAQTGYGFSSEALMKNFAAAATRTVGTNYYAQYRYHAFFGRVNYSWKNKYILNITTRRDGSSRFGPGKQFATFGAVGAAWVFSEESFIKSGLPFLSFGKLRTSYGSTGNDQLGDYQYLDAYASSSGSYQGNIGLQPVRLSNPNFAWETNKKFEAAIELSFFDDRISAAFSYYRNRSSNQLIGFPLASTTGFNNIQGNFPATVQNTGIEIELLTVNTRKGSFLTWSSSINFSMPRNKLVDFPNLDAFPAYANTYVVGKPLSILKLYNYTGIDPSTGIYTFEDVNDDGSYDFNDRQTVRFVGQDFFGGVNNSLQLKRFQVDFLFQFVKQTGNNYLNYFDAPGLLANAPVYVTDRWRDTDDHALVQRFSQTGDPLTAYSRLTASQQVVGDASFVRLKNISISYSLPQGLVERAHMGQLRIFIQAQNLITFTNYDGLDPELPASSQLPPLRVVTVGVHINL